MARLFNLMYSGSPLLPCALVLAAAVACFGIPAYFISLRPKKGTTEWMTRIDPPHFSALPAARLRPMDAVWALLAAFSAAALQFSLRIAALFLYHRAKSELFPVVCRYLTVQLALTAAFAVAVYLLLRVLFSGPKAAILLAVTGALLQGTSIGTSTAVVLSLLFLYCWLSAPADAPLLPSGLWLVLSGGCFAAAVLLRWACVWLLPIYICSYVAGRVCRWRRGDPENRVGRLIASVVSVFVLTAVGGLLMIGIGALRNGRFNLVELFSAGAVEKMLPLLETRMRLLVRPLHFRASVRVTDALLFLTGCAAWVCVLHGAWKLRDTRCLWLLLLPLPFAAAWLVGGVYLLSIPMLAAVGWQWKTYILRDRTFCAGLSMAVLLVCYGALLLI